ncbi:MAG: exodeoxyribonuclease III, partial [Deltaproteobacteria bacterium]|nr:exodeoxyribonuclease III [Deltaproteobacteria bacterium]
MASSFPDISEILDILAEEVSTYAVPVVDLIAVQSRDPYQVLVATILSARTRDETTAKAAARLFKKAPDIKALAALSAAALEKLIYPVGFFKNKARFLHQLPAALNVCGGTVPDTLEQLMELPGVGRKTANLVLSVAFETPAICVDTHVHRIMNIWGFVVTQTPLQTETALREQLPRSDWQRVNSILVAFGQGTCKPRRPHCDRCVISERCPQIGVTPRTVPGTRKAAVAGEVKRLVSWNVNGIRAVEKKGLVDIINELDA